MFLDQMDRLREIADPTENISRAGIAGAGTNSAGRMGRTMAWPTQASKQAGLCPHLTERTPVSPGQLLRRVPGGPSRGAPKSRRRAREGDELRRRLPLRGWASGRVRDSPALAAAGLLVAALPWVASYRLVRYRNRFARLPASMTIRRCSFPDRSVPCSLRRQERRAWFPPRSSRI